MAVYKSLNRIYGQLVNANRHFSTVFKHVLKVFVVENSGITQDIRLITEIYKTTEQRLHNKNG